jgi:hypothetical protein
MGLLEGRRGTEERAPFHLRQIDVITTAYLPIPAGFGQERKSGFPGDVPADRNDRRSYRNVGFRLPDRRVGQMP